MGPAPAGLFPPERDYPETQLEMRQSHQMGSEAEMGQGSAALPNRPVQPGFFLTENYQEMEDQGEGQEDNHSDPNIEDAAPMIQDVH